MRTLACFDVDLKAREVRLRPENSKTNEPRTLPLWGELLEIVERAHANRRLDIPSVFHRHGRAIAAASFRRAWRRAAHQSGLGALVPHDMRRSCVRNLVRAGIPERVCMMLSGHKTRTVFDRYHIVASADLHDAARRLDGYLREQTIAKVAVLKTSIEQAQTAG